MGVRVSQKKGNSDGVEVLLWWLCDSDGDENENYWKMHRVSCCGRVGDRVSATYRESQLVNERVYVSK